MFDILTFESKSQIITVNPDSYRSVDGDENLYSSTWIVSWQWWSNRPEGQGSRLPVSYGALQIIQHWYFQHGGSFMTFGRRVLMMSTLKTYIYYIYIFSTGKRWMNLLWGWQVALWSCLCCKVILDTHTKRKHEQICHIGTSGSSGPFDWQVSHAIKLSWAVHPVSTPACTGNIFVAPTSDRDKTKPKLQNI